MVGCKLVRDDPGKARFVMIGAVKTNRAGLHWLRTCLCHQCHNSRRIDSARKERAQRNIRHHPRGNSRTQPFFHFRDQRHPRSRRARREIEVPPDDRPGDRRAALQEEV